MILNCVHCGAEISERQEICTLCGKYARVAGAASTTPREPDPPAQTPVATKPEQTSTATLEKKNYRGAAFCTMCNELVYLNEEGGCERGHPASAIRDKKDTLGGLTPEDYFDRAMGTDNASGKGAVSAMPAEIRGWNWGAFFFTWIWGIGNNTWIAFLSWVPYVGIVMPFVLGFKGNEWAWKNKRWNSVGHFKRIQRNWAIAGLIYTIITVGLVVLVFVLLTAAAGTAQLSQAPSALPK